MHKVRLPSIYVYISYKSNPYECSSVLLFYHLDLGLRNTFLRIKFYILMLYYHISLNATSYPQELSAAERN
jgi:hypothetical protein